MPSSKSKTDNATAQNAKMNQERTFLSSLLSSALDGDGTKVKSLTSNYAKEHKLTCMEVLSQFKDGNKRNAIHFACQSSTSGKKQEPKDDEQIDIISTLLESNWLSNTATEALLRSKDKDGLTPLMIVAQHPSPAISAHRTKLILTIGGTKCALARSNAGATALHYAAGMGASPTTLKRLYEAGSICLRTNSSKGGMPLHWIAGTSPKKEKEEDFANALTTLISFYDAEKKKQEANPDSNTPLVDIVNAPNEQGMPPLILAAAANNDKHASLLVEHGADWMTLLPGNVTLLHMAADLNLIRTLNSIMTLPDQDTHLTKFQSMTNDQGETPLDLAAGEGHVGCVMLLLPQGNNSEEEARQYIQQYQATPKAKPTTPSPTTQTTNTDSKMTHIEAQTLTKITNLQTQTPLPESQIKTALEHKQIGNQHFLQKNYPTAILEYTNAISLKIGRAHV